MLIWNLATMKSAHSLQFLRPFVYGRLPVSNQVYLQFYQAARRHGLATSRCLASAAIGQQGKPDVASTKEDALEIRSHAVAARIEELNKAHALDYPRIQKNSNSVKPMRISTFKEKYRDVSAENPGQEEVVLHGE